MNKKDLAKKALQEALLLMNYDPSKTLTENLEEVSHPLLEQVQAQPQVVDYDVLVDEVMKDGGLIDLLDIPTSEGDLDKVITLFKKYDNTFAKDKAQGNKTVPALEIMSRVYKSQGLLTMGETLESSINNTTFLFGGKGDEKKRIALSLLERLKKQVMPSSGAETPEIQWEAGDAKSQQTFLQKLVYEGCLSGGGFKKITNPKIQDLVMAYVIPEQGPDGVTADVYYWANMDSGYYDKAGKYVSLGEWVC